MYLINSNFYKLAKEDKLSEIYGEIVGLDNKILIFDKCYNSEQFKYRKFLFINVEHILFSTYLVLGKEFKIEDVLAIFTAMPETFIDDLNRENKIFLTKAIYFLKSFAYEEKILLKNIKFYLNQKNEHIQRIKLFSYLENGNIVFNKPKYLKDRPKIYKDVINNVVSEHLGKNESIKVKIKDDRINKKLIERIKEKSNYKNSIRSEINSIIKNIDKEFISSMGNYYSSEIRNIKIYNVKDGEIKKSEELFKLVENYTHLAGKTGAGKTVYTDIIIKSLSMNGKKMLIITDTTDNAIKYKERLDELGVNSTILVGKKRNNYLDRYLKLRNKSLI